MCLTRLEVTSSDFKSRRWHQLGRRNSALPSFDGPGVPDFNQRMDRDSHNAISRPDTAGRSTAKVVLASCCLGPGFSASTLAQHSAVALRNERNKWTNMENIGNWHSCPQLQITAGNIQVVCQEAGEEAWPFQMLQVNSPADEPRKFFQPSKNNGGILRLPMQSFGFTLQMCFWRNLQSLINMLRLIGVHRLAFFDCFTSSEHVYGPQKY